MPLRNLVKIHSAVRDDMDSLVTRRALPTKSVEHIDPFLFLNHHGPQTYPAGNEGLPFGPHPHRGFETVTVIIKGDIEHRDSAGHASCIRAGGFQWMTAGRGLVHSELSSEEFKKNGGEMEILQLWVNLPSRLKMTKPNYVGLQREQIPQFSLEGGGGILNLVSGTWQGQAGPIESLTQLFLATIELSAKAEFKMSVPQDRSIFCYVVQGEVNVNGKIVQTFQLAEFGHDGDEILISAAKNSFILFGHGIPFNEPIVAHGPFVMNTRQEILKAIQDYQAGEFS